MVTVCLLWQHLHASRERGRALMHCLQNGPARVQGMGAHPVSHMMCADTSAVACPPCCLPMQKLPKRTSCVQLPAS